MKWVLIVILHTMNQSQGGISSMQVEFSSQETCLKARQEIVGYLDMLRRDSEERIGKPVPNQSGVYYSGPAVHLRGKVFCAQR